MELDSLPASELAQMVRELEATKASLMLEHQTAREVLDDQMRRASVLTQLAIELREALDPAAIVKQALKVLYRGLVAFEASILLVRENMQPDLGMAIRSGELVQVERDLMEAVLADGLAGWIVQHRSDAMLADITADPRWLLITERHTVGSVIAVPIQQGEAVIGALTVTRHTVNAFTSRDLLLMEGVAAQVGLALRAAHHYHSERRRREQALAILAMSQFLTAERSFTDLASVLQEQCAATFDATFGLLFLTGEGGALTPTLAPGQSPPPAALRRAGQAARQAWERQSIVNDGGAGDTHGYAYVAQPLAQSGQRIGAFVLVRPAATQGFSASLWSLLSLFTQVVASACASMRMVARLRSDAVTLESLVAQRTRQLTNSRDSLRAIVDHIPEGLLLIDEAGQVLAANQTFCRAIVGCAPPEIIGRSYAAILEQIEARGDTPVESGAERRLGSPALLVRCRDAAGAPRIFRVERYPIAEHPQQVEYWREERAPPVV
jgi:GAF domain-containing protein